jgi:hypothetical protein
MTPLQKPDSRSLSILFVAYIICLCHHVSQLGNVSHPCEQVLCDFYTCSNIVAASNDVSGMCCILESSTALCTLLRLSKS